MVEPKKLPLFSTWEKVFLAIGIGALLVHFLLLPWMLPDSIRVGIILMAGIGILPVFVTQYIIRPLQK